MQSDKTKSKSSLLIIFFTVFIDLVGFGIIIPVLQPYARLYGATDFQAGLLVGTFSAIQFFVIPIWGWLSDRFGRKPIVLAGLLGTSLSYLVLAVAPNLATLFVGRILAGLFAGNLVAAQAYIADVTPPENRAHGMGLIGVAFGLGFILGPVIGGILSHYSFSHPSYAAAIASGLAFLFGLTELRESLPPEKRPKHAPLRHPILNVSHVTSDKLVFRVILANFFFVTAFAMWDTVFVLFVGNHILTGLSETQLSRRVGYLIAFAGLVSALIQGGAIRPMVKRYGEKNLVQAGFMLLIAGCLGFLGLTFWGGSQSSVSLIPLLILIGIGSGLSNPTLIAMASKLAHPERQGEVLGAFRGIGSLARAVGPLCGAFLFGKVSQASPYAAGAVLLMVSAMLLWGRFEYYQSSPSDE